MKRLIFRNYKNKSRSFLRNVNSNGTTLCQHERHIYCEPINAETCHLNGSQVIHAPRFAMWRLPHSPRLAINLQYSLHTHVMPGGPQWVPCRHSRREGRDSCCGTSWTMSTRHSSGTPAEGGGDQVM